MNLTILKTMNLNKRRPKAPDMTTEGLKVYENILIKLGKKTKVTFIEALKKEFKNIYSTNHQMLTSADVLRVAIDLKLIPQDAIA